MGVYLKPIVAKDKYELVADGKPIAVLQLIVAKSGTETAALLHGTNSTWPWHR